MIRWKTFPWVLGLALLAFSLVAARLLNADTPVHTGAGGNPPPRVTSAAGPVGPSILGWVDSTPTAVRLDAPAVLGMPSLTISKVLVSEGDTVEVGQVLAEFDPSAFKHDLAQAEQELIAAQWEVQQARLAGDDWEWKKKQQRLAVETAELELKLAIDARDRGREVFERTLDEAKQFGKLEPLTEEQRKQRRQENQELFRLEGAAELLKKKVEKEQNDLKRLDAAALDSRGNLLPAPAIDVQRANAKVGVIQAKIEKAKAQLEAFKLKAQEGGVVEQMTAVAGKTYGPTAREPLLWIIPVGKRVVRAEMEAEFAYKYESHRGKAVTVCDHYNPAIAYPGVLVRIGTAFLPKRFGADAFAPSPARVLECTVEVTDPAPPGKPPLRPGQQVRVVFGP